MTLRAATRQGIFNIKLVTLFIALAGLVSLGKVIFVLYRWWLWSGVLSASNWSSEIPLLGESEIPINDSIFYVETNADISELPARTLCALESAAGANPDKLVFMLIPAKSQIVTWPNYFKSSLPNILFRYYDVALLAHDSRLLELWESGEIQASPYRLSHTSDFLRFLLLHKFGGVYNDQDVLHVKPLPEDVANFVISEGNNRFLTSAVLRMERGHRLLDIITKRLATNYEGTLWNHNGPAVLTYAINAYCDNPPKIPPPGDYFVALNCPTVTIYPASMGCPLKAKDFGAYYDSDQAAQVDKRVADSLVVHYFNNMRNLRANLTVMSSEHPLYKIMEKVCPVTEEQVLRYNVGRSY